MQITDELATYLQPGPLSVIVASSGAEPRPELVRGWGLCLDGDGSSITVCLGRQAAARLLQNIEVNDRLAVSICNVTSYQSLQLKGRCAGIREPRSEDLERVREHGEAFVAGVQLVGVPEPSARNLLVSDLVCLRFVPELLFDQTPGPHAGEAR